jgi:hypothetical protein
MITTGSVADLKNAVRIDQALRFLRALTAGLPARLWLELRTFAREPRRVRQRWDRLDQLESSAHWCIAQSDRGHDVYAAVQPRRGRSGSAAAVAAIVALYADVDCGEGKRFTNKADAIARLQSFALLGLAPSLLVDSGNGFHAYWPLREALEPSDQDAWQSAMRALASSLDADPTVTDLPRILRVPGTLNWKNADDPKTVRLIHCDEARRFVLYDFDDLPPVVVSAAPRRSYVPVTVAGSRVIAAIRAAGWRVHEKRDASGKLIALVLDEPCPFCPGRPVQADAPRRGTAHVAPSSGAFRCKRALCGAGAEATGQRADGEPVGLAFDRWAQRVSPATTAAAAAATTTPPLTPFKVPSPARLPVLRRLAR